MPRAFDLYLSYHRSDAEPARRLAAALEARGVACAAAGGGRSSPAAGLPAELGASKVVLAWGSEDYFRARHCQMELAAAYIASAREASTAPERLLLVNGAAGVKHIYPTHLRDLVVAPAPGLPDAWDYDELAESLRDHCEGVAGTLEDICALGAPARREAFDIPLPASPRFEGRERELWDIHDTFQPPAAGKAPTSTAVVVSAGSGQGKSALAREYALRFGPAYPGGIFRISAAAAQPGASTAELGVCPHLRLQLGALLRALAPDADPEALDAPGLSRALGEKLAAAGQPFLWIVDDLPDRLSGPAFRLWLAPAAPLGRSLILTRANRYQQRATVLHLPPLDPLSAHRLLTGDSAPVGENEREAVAGLLAELGRQPMGLAAAGELAQQDRRNRHGRYAALWRRLDDHGPAAEDLAARLPDEWPRSSEIGIASVLLHALETLEEPGRDLLRLAAILPKAGIALDFAAACLEHSGLSAAGRRGRAFALFLTEPVAEPLDARAAEAHARAGAEALERLSFAERTEHGVRVHPLAARALALTDHEPARTRALERAVLDVLDQWADHEDPLVAWQRLAPLAAPARRLALDVPAEADDAADDPIVRHRRLRLACVLAEIDAARGAPDQALEAYRSAAGQLLRAITDEPGNGKRQRDFAVLQERIGELLEAKGDLAGALDCFRKSLGIRILGTQIGGASRPSELLRHHERIGSLLERLGDAEGALQSYCSAHAILDKRAARKDAGSEHRFRLATSLLRLAGLYRSLQRLSAAEAALAAAAPFLRKLAEEHPDKEEYLHLRADVEGQLGDACLARREFDRARDRYSAALAAAERRAGLQPHCGEARGCLARCHDRLGNALAALQDRAGAAAQFRAFIALSERSAEMSHAETPPRELAVAHIKLGIALEGTDEPDRAAALNEYRIAAGILEQLAAPDPKNPEVAKDLAWVNRRITLLGGRDSVRTRS